MATRSVRGDPVRRPRLPFSALSAGHYERPRAQRTFFTTLDFNCICPKPGTFASMS